MSRRCQEYIFTDENRGINMNHLGTVELETTRLRLRRFKIEDADEMYKNWASEDEVWYSILKEEYMRR